MQMMIGLVSSLPMGPPALLPPAGSPPKWGGGGGGGAHSQLWLQEIYVHVHVCVYSSVQFA